MKAGRGDGYLPHDIYMYFPLLPFSFLLKSDVVLLIYSFFSSFLPSHINGQPEHDIYCMSQVSYFPLLFVIVIVIVIVIVLVLVFVLVLVGCWLLVVGCFFVVFFSKRSYEPLYFRQTFFGALALLSLRYSLFLVDRCWLLV